MIILSKYLLWMFIYSFLGWVYESTVCSINERSFVNRGFLNGPVCPVYGVGALVSVFVIGPVTDDVVVMFFLGMFLTCTVEYITAVLLEKLFNAKWWDYSYKRFNFQGRVCLLGAVVFGILSVIVIKYVHPLVEGITSQLTHWQIIMSAVLIFLVFMVDLHITVRHLLLLNGRLEEIQAAFNDFVDHYSKRAENIKNSMLVKFEESEFYSERIKNLVNIGRFQNIRLARAFPKLKPLKYDDAWQKLKNILLNINKKS